MLDCNQIHCLEHSNLLLPGLSNPAWCTVPVKNLKNDKIEQNECLGTSHIFKGLAELVIHLEIAVLEHPIQLVPVYFSIKTKIIFKSALTGFQFKTSSIVQKHE